MIRPICLFALALSAIACQAPAENAEPAPSPALSEKRDADLVGVWNLVPPGKSELTLSEQGTSRIVSEANSPEGVMKSDVEGTWAAEEGKLSMRRKDPQGIEFTVVYDYALEKAGKELTLTREGRKAKQRYVRAK